MKGGRKESFEKRLERLDIIVSQLEEGNLPLDRSVALYREGMQLARACREQLDEARNAIRICTDEGLRPFDPETGEMGEPVDDSADDATTDV